MLKDIDLPIEAGDFIVLLGPSGCGKSTLLTPSPAWRTSDSGIIEIDERIVTSRTQRARHRDGVPVLCAVSAMSVRKNISFGLRVRRPAAGGDRRVRAAELLQIDRLARPQPVAAFRRPAPARRHRPRMVRNPEVFLFDEPLSNLDAKLRVEIRVELKRLHKRSAPPSST